MNVSAKAGSLRGTARRIVLAAAMLGMVAGMATPAAAQFSASYKFLDAVKKADGEAVTDALNKPGTQIVNTRDVTTGETALHIVTKRRDKTWMSFLLEHDADPNVHDRDGVTPIQIATGLGFTEGVQLLLQYRADPRQANDTGETPLITAVHRRDLQMVKLLIAGGSEPARPDSSGRSAIDYAKLDGQDQILAALKATIDHKGAADPSRPSYGPSF